MTTAKHTWMLIFVTALIAGSLLWLLFVVIAGPEAQEVSVEQSYVGGDGKVVIEIANRTDEILDNIYLVLRPFNKDDEVLPTSLNERVLIHGPWVGGYEDQLGDIEYMGLQQTPRGESVLTYSIMPRMKVKTYFILKPKFIHKYGMPESYHIEVFRIGNHEPLAAQTGGRLTGRLPDPVLLLAFAPLLLVLLLLMPGLRHCLPVFPETGLKRPRPWFSQADKFVAVMLVVLATSSFLHINGPFPAQSDPDSFDYLSISEVFDVDMESCIGKWDKGYDRREFLHQVPDRSWGYPLFLSIVAKSVGIEEIGCQEYMRIVQSLQIFMLVLSCLIAAMLLYRVWTPSNFPYIRSALIYSVLLLHSYNFHPVNSMLTEVMSRLLFVVCLAGSFGLLFSGSNLRRHWWTVLAVTSAVLATIVRPEHILIEPVIVAGFVLVLLLRHRTWAVFRTFIFVSVASMLVVSYVSYVKFGTLQHSTATGFRLLNVIHRLEPRALHLDEIPPGVQLNEEQTQFFNEVIIPAAKTEWGKSNPWIAVPGFLQDQTPLEMSKTLRQFSFDVLFQNMELWIASTWHRFKLLAVGPNQTRPGTTDTLQKKFNLFGFSEKNSMWFAAILAWILGRYLLSKKGPLPTRGSIEFAIVIMVSMYFYMFLSAAVEVGAIRTRYFSSGFIPLLGMLIALDAVELIMNTCVRCVTEAYRRTRARFA